MKWILAESNINDYLWIIILAVGILLIAALIAILVALKKKNKRNNQRKVLLDNRDLVASNAASVDVLLVLAKDKPQIAEALKLLQDKLKYLSPSTSDEVKKIDQKIASIIGDIKIELNKSKGEECEKAQRYIDDINVKIAERGIYTQK